MTQKKPTKEEIMHFLSELEKFAKTAESTLVSIQSNPTENRHLFSVFYEEMFAIRGTADQLQLEELSLIAGLGEEIAAKAGGTSTSRAHLRKCVSSLWDAVTTTRYLLEHYGEKTLEEQEILIHRLKDALRVLGGPEAKVTPDEIEELLKKRS